MHGYRYFLKNTRRQIPTLLKRNGIHPSPLRFCPTLFLHRKHRRICYPRKQNARRFPKTCAQLFLQKPIFSYDGSFIGKLFDGCLTLEKSGEFTAVSLQTDDNQTVLVSSIYSVLDAVILRKNRVYPLGQRIPAPILSLLGQQNQPTVTKTVLQRAIEKNNLITLTLSLPPFNQVLR